MLLHIPFFKDKKFGLVVFHQQDYDLLKAHPEIKKFYFTNDFGFKHIFTEHRLLTPIIAEDFPTLVRGSPRRGFIVWI